MAHTTCIRNAAWIVAWDAAAGTHVYLRDADLAFSGNTILHVGKSWPGTADTTIDGRALMLIPGLVDIHSHPSTEPFFRGIREEHGVPAMFMSGLYERSFAFRTDAEGRAPARPLHIARCCAPASRRSPTCPAPMPAGSTSRLKAACACSSHLAMRRRAGIWKTAGNSNTPGTRRPANAACDDALALIAAAAQHPSGRLSGVVFPAQIDTCTEALLRESWEAAEALDLPFTTHCAQSVNEFNEMVNRHGKTPIRWARDIGILGPRSILGHAIFTDEHSWTRWHTKDDVNILAETGASVAHCPSPFARYGQTLEDFGRYRRAGVNIGLGTDVSPHNLIEEMRLAAILARVAAQDINTTSTAAMFHAATVGGATALGRDDIGRLAPGARADLVLVDLTNPFMLPARDPLRSLVYTAADRAVQSVFVDGAKVVEAGRVLTLDHAEALGLLAEAQARMEADVPNHDWAQRRADEIAPLSLPVRN